MSGARREKKKKRIGLAEVVVSITLLLFLSGFYFVPQYGREPETLVFMAASVFCLLMGVVLFLVFKTDMRSKKKKGIVVGSVTNGSTAFFLTGLILIFLILTICIPATALTWMLSYEKMLMIYGGGGCALLILLLTLWYNPKGRESSTTHKWVYKKTGGVYGDVTVRQLYEQKHGADSWPRKVKRDRFVIRVVLMTASAALAYLYLSNTELTAGIASILVIFCLFSYWLPRKKKRK